MGELTRAQVVVYGAIAVALLLVGVRAIEAGGGDSSGTGGGGDGVAVAAGGGSFRVEGRGGDVVVHVAGAVRRPGVYRLPAGSRVDDAVRRAGGASGRAVVDRVNLAARLADGQQVVVPALGAGGASVAGGTAEDGPISLGTATVEQLDTIEGIGPVTAQDIVEFREQHGGLASVEQLDQISGIGPATMESLRERLQP